MRTNLAKMKISYRNMYVQFMGEKIPIQAKITIKNLASRQVINNIHILDS
jgi:hypothetical protein